MGMGGAFLARADDATAASWNPAGLSYLRLPEVSLVGVCNSFDISRGLNSDNFKGQTSTSPRSPGRSRSARCAGPSELSYQRAISFDGPRQIGLYDANGAHDAVTTATATAAST